MKALYHRHYRDKKCFSPLAGIKGNESSLNSAEVEIFTCFSPLAGIKGNESVVIGAVYGKIYRVSVPLRGLKEMKDYHLSRRANR